MPYVSCIICKKDFYKRPNQIQKTHRNFCSKRCYGFSCRKEIECPVCGKKFLSGKNTKTCSHSCANIYRTGIKYKNDKFTDGDKTKRIKTTLSLLYGYKCSICNLSTWQGKLITLQLDHIDGNRNNNEVFNLRLLCPNCHSQTSTFGGKNKMRYNNILENRR